ncbi:hypothetical protein R3P38DRAFT_3293726 [Favolaschia claudopus]|uniref:Uncharacterized protein n=1 Tax=Favolaschia claudopus TaxID=2862362 RepID=A0AAV9ZH21_9AGAR
MNSHHGESEPLHGTLSGSRVSTIHVSMPGGVGGPGGRGGQDGGTGGNGEGGRLYISSTHAVVNIRGHRLNDLDDQDSQDDFNFRRIRWGDVHLQRLSAPQNRCSVRIVRSAKINGGAFTVATYEGNSAEWASPIPCAETVCDRCFQQWKRDVEMHENILQLYGTVRHRKICASVFHGDVVPFKEFLKPYQHSAILTRYIHGYVAHDLKSVDDYLGRSLDRDFYYPDDSDYYSGSDDSLDSDEHWHWGRDLRHTMRAEESRLCDHWHIYETPRPSLDRAMLIDCSTGCLSIDLAGPFNHHWNWDRYSSFSLDEPLFRNPIEVLSSTDFNYIAQAITVNQYHQYLSLNYKSLSKKTWYSVISSTAAMHLGGVYSVRNNNSLEVVALQQLPSNHDIAARWRVERSYGGYRGKLDGDWRRYPYHRMNGISSSDFHICCHFRYSFSEETPTAWLSQANHFGYLHGKSDFHKYVLVEEIFFVAELGRSREHSKTSLDGFLFLCPRRDFVTGAASFEWPSVERCWYWSLCSSGVPKLSQEEATELGFPTIQLVTKIRVRSWNESAYVGLRELHKISRFDPETQDLAVELQEPWWESFSDQQSITVKECGSCHSCLVSEQFEKWDNISEESTCGSDSGRKDSATSEEGRDVIRVFDSDDCEDITLSTDREFTSFNENDEFTGRTSTSASFIPLLDSRSSIGLTFRRVDARLEESCMTSALQRVSEWVRSQPTWDNSATYSTQRCKDMVRRRTNPNIALHTMGRDLGSITTKSPL